MFVRGIRIQIFAAVALLFASCGRPAHKSNDNQAAINGDTREKSESSSPELTADQAIGLVKHMIDQQGLSASLSLPTTMTEMGSTPCSPQEAETDQDANPNNPELWRCKSPSGAPPFMKQALVTHTVCCTVQRVTIHSSDIANWRAEPADDDRWAVYASYAVLGANHQSFWLVNRQTSQIGSQSDK
jgi:hypothetical protein